MRKDKATTVMLPSPRNKKDYINVVQQFLESTGLVDTNVSMTILQKKRHHPSKKVHIYGTEYVLKMTSITSKRKPTASALKINKK